MTKDASSKSTNRVPPICRSSPRLSNKTLSSAKGQVPRSANHHTTTASTPVVTNGLTRANTKTKLSSTVAHGANNPRGNAQNVRNPHNMKNGYVRRNGTNLGYDKNGCILDDDGYNNKDDEDEESFVSTVENQREIDGFGTVDKIPTFSLSGDEDDDEEENVCDDEEKSTDLLVVEVATKPKPTKRSTNSLMTKGKKDGTCNQASVTGKSVGNRNRNYAELEDFLITKAYVSVSTDAVYGSQQKGNIFWSKVHQKFKLFAAKEPGGKDLGGRPVDSLKQRYTKVIGKGVSKYNKFYRTLKNENKSGWIEDMYLEEAATLYEEEEGRPFRFLSCVQVLHKVPKFDPMVSPDTDAQPKKDHKVHTLHPPQGASIDRPIGTKKAKIVKYLKDSGVLLGDNKNDDSVISSATSNTKAIESLLQNNYDQRERAMKLKRVKLYIDLGEREKARTLMREIEEAESKNEEAVNNADSVEVMEEITPTDPPCIPMPPGMGAPVGEIVINGNETYIESQLTEM